MSNFFEVGKAALTSNSNEWETPQARELGIEVPE